MGDDEDHGARVPMASRAPPRRQQQQRGCSARYAHGVPAAASGARSVGPRRVLARGLPNPLRPLADPCMTCPCALRPYERCAKPEHSRRHLAGGTATSCRSRAVPLPRPAPASPARTM
eukprot:2685446-Prymnesium_polylepis.1